MNAPFTVTRGAMRILFRDERSASWENMRNLDAVNLIQHDLLENASGGSVSGHGLVGPLPHLAGNAISR